VRVLAEAALRIGRMAAVLGVMGLAGCMAPRPAGMPLEAGAAPGRDVIARTLAGRPREVKRSITGEIFARGERIKVTGMLDFHGSLDFRLSLAMVGGPGLFDGRYDWAGIHLRSCSPGFDDRVAVAMIEDVSMALREPRSLEGLDAAEHVTLLRVTGGDAVEFTYEFAGAQGALRRLTVMRGPFDGLEVQFPGYEARGWPKGMTLYRPAYGYSAEFTFGQ